MTLETIDIVLTSPTPEFTAPGDIPALSTTPAQADNPGVTSTGGSSESPHAEKPSNRVPLSVNTGITERTTLLHDNSFNAPPPAQQQKLQQRPSILPEIASISHPLNRKVTRMGSATQLFLYTKSVPTPKLRDTIRTFRFMVRLAQVSIAIAAFTSAAYGAFRFDYPYHVLGSSGISFMMLTSISSVVSCNLIFGMRTESHSILIQFFNSLINTFTMF